MPASVEAEAVGRRGGDPITDQRLLEFAQASWGPYQGHAALYLRRVSDPDPS